MKEYLKLALVNLRQRSLRTLLTMIGIFIGIAAVVALLSLGQGLQKAINSQFSSVGADKLIIQGSQAGFGPPGSNTAGSVTKHDRDIIRNTPGIMRTAGRIYSGSTVEFESEVQTQFIASLPDEPDEFDLIIEALSLEPIQGRMLRPGEKNKIMLGSSYGIKDALFSKPLEPGNKLTVAGTRFEVIGIVDSTGDPVLDKAVYLSEKDIRDVLHMPEQYQAIVAQVQAGSDPVEVAEQVRKAMRKDRHQKEGHEDFTVTTSEDLIKSFNQILLIVQAVVIGISMISLLVGGIGIMNTMFTSVLERTKEIGIMKAIGAKRRDIQILFLLESGLLGLIGGLVGVTIGISLSTLVEFAAKQALGTNLLQASASPLIIIGALLFSSLIGTISGFLPARRAAKLNPVDALRYE